MILHEAYVLKEVYFIGDKGTLRSLNAALWRIYHLLVRGFLPRSGRLVDRFLVKLFIWCPLLISCWRSHAVSEKINLTSLHGEGQAVANKTPKLQSKDFSYVCMAGMQSNLEMLGRPVVERNSSVLKSIILPA